MFIKFALRSYSFKRLSINISQAKASNFLKQAIKLRNLEYRTENGINREMSYGTHSQSVQLHTLYLLLSNTLTLSVVGSSWKLVKSELN